MADEAVKRIARRVYSERILGGKVVPEQVKTSEWRAWLNQQPWFNKDENQLAENFPLAVKHLLQPQNYRQGVLLDLIRPSEGIGKGYRDLAELVLRGLAGTILTTNFDMCLPQALYDKRPHIRLVAEVNRGPDDFREFDIFQRAQIVWLHGKAEQYTDKNLTEEVASLDPKLVSALFPLLQSTPLVVIGYRGAEPSVMECLLGENGDLAFKKGIFWCQLSGGDLHPNVKALQQRLGGNFRLLEIDGFDELFHDINVELAGQQRNLGSPISSSEPEFDDRPVDNATLADLDLDLALHTAHEYAKKLGLREPTSATLPTFLRELGLLVDVKGTEKPSNAAMLLFGIHPQRFFPHAVVSVTIDGKRRQVISGNLLKQRVDLLEWISDNDVNPILKVKVLGRHVERPAYHERALVELTVNLLVHRDYEDVRPAAINVEPGSLISFLNPGRPSERLTDKLTIDDQGTFEPVREMTSQRNRSLCDVFYGMSVMERAGTGLSDVVKYAREASGAAVFRLPPGDDEFRAEIFQPNASGRFAGVARDTRPIGTYVLNVLPFAALPEAVSRVNVQGTLREIASAVPLEEAGTVLLHGSELWSLAPPPLLRSILQPVMSSEIRTSERKEIEADPDLARVFSWLLRKHFEGRLKALRGLGLVIEENNKSQRRAFFVGLNKGSRKYVYDSPTRKSITREVVKCRSDKPPFWFENEGFSYDIARMGSTWSVRLKPFYMFTGADAITPLPGYSRTKRATRRMKFDRNQSVDSDLVFWGRFIAQGAPVINLSQVAAQDMLLEGSFLSLDVPEEGLVDDDRDEDQMPA
ncbi:SIR2 family protein [Tardiphaga sp. P5_C7]